MDEFDRTNLLRKKRIRSVHNRSHPPINCSLDPISRLHTSWTDEHANTRIYIYTYIQAYRETYTSMLVRFPLFLDKILDSRNCADPVNGPLAKARGTNHDLTKM